MGEFVKRYVMSVIALMIALVFLFWLLNLIGTRGPGVIGVAAEKAGSLASGQAYTFK